MIQCRREDPLDHIQWRAVAKSRWITSNGVPFLSHIGGRKQTTHLTVIVAVVIIELIISEDVNFTFAVVTYYFLLYQLRVASYGSLRCYAHSLYRGTVKEVAQPASKQTRDSTLIRLGLLLMVLCKHKQPNYFNISGDCKNER